MRFEPEGWSEASDRRREFKLEKTAGGPRFVLAREDNGQAAASDAAPALTSSADPGHSAHPAVDPDPTSSRGRRGRGGRAAKSNKARSQGRPEPRPDAAKCLVVEAPSLANPNVLASVVSFSSASAIQADYIEAGLEVTTVPTATAPSHDGSPAQSHVERWRADPTPRDMVEDPEVLASAALPTARRRLREPYSAPRPAPASLFVVAFLLGFIVVLLTQLRSVALREVPAALTGHVAQLASHQGKSRLFERGLDGSLQTYLRKGYKAVVMQNEDGTLSNQQIYEDMLSKDLASVQEMARVKAELLGHRLCIIASDPAPDAQPYVVDVVNPDDRMAWRDYMMRVWDLKQSSLAFARERYVARGSLDPQRTLGVMTDFVRSHPDSRMVEQALADMRYVCYFVLQDPAKFREVMIGLLDDSFKWAINSGNVQSAPELARVINPFLKEAMNQLLYQRIHRWQGPSKPSAAAGNPTD